ncbi:hypothetical protein V5O48_015224 [Marasmius crinis-equi]|uniref:Protein kinase domain-containing protein n=1 Tax=Marasmius crinis-equi TaxID=585013 RepID=A0ABR3EV50_9AGAR
MNLARLYSPSKVRSANGLNDVLRMVEDMLGDEQKCRRLLEARDDEAQKCLDTLQLIKLADGPNIDDNLRSSILKMMLHLSKHSGLCPNFLFIRNVKKIGAFPVGGGRFGDVWKGKIGEQLVCLKVVKVYLTSDVAHLMKEYIREAIVWQQLKHPNLLPFIGMYYLDKAREQLCLVSPWMGRGDLLRYLNETPREHVDHQVLAYDVAAGVSYLHEKKIIHGDLKSVNILVTPEERACIGDFGLSRVADSHGLRLSTPSGQTRGTIRWLSPELLEPPCHSSTRSDIYAYACVCYEIFTGNTPFHELVEGAVIVALLLHKRHPTRPENIAELTDSMWEIMVSCWAHEDSLRPTAEDVLSRVGALRSLKSGEVVGSQPAADWESADHTHIRKNLKYHTVDTSTLVGLLQKEETRMAVPSSSPLSTSFPPASSSRRDSSAELLTKSLPLPTPYITVQLESGDDPESDDFDNVDFWHDDGWEASSGAHISSRASAEDEDKDYGRSPSRESEERRHSREPTARIIPPDEDTRKLFQECIIAKGNASFLSQSLVHMTPEDFFEELGGDRGEGEGAGNAIVKELRMNCIASEEFIAAQLPRAFASAERSRREAGEGEEETTEERLLGDLLATNEMVMASLGRYEDLERVASERKAGEGSQRDVGGEEERDEIERQIPQLGLDLSLSRPQPLFHDLSANLVPSRVSLGPVGGSRVPSPNLRTGTAPRTPPSSPPTPPLPVPPRKSSPGSRPSSTAVFGGENNYLAPPPVPHGPRILGLRSCSPGKGSIHSAGGEGRRTSVIASSDDDSDRVREEYRPSEKALEKSHAAENDDESVQETSHQPQQHVDDFARLRMNGSPMDDWFSVNYTDEDGSHSDGEKGPGYPGHHHAHPPVQYV